MTTAIVFAIIAGVTIGCLGVGARRRRWRLARRARHAAFIEHELQEQLKTMAYKSPEELTRDIVVDQLTRLAAAVRAGQVTGIKFTWEGDGYPVIALELRAQATQIIFETDLELDEIGGD